MTTRPMLPRNAPLTIVTWLWGEKYGTHYVRRLYAALKRNLSQKFRFLCVTDGQPMPPGIELGKIWDPELTKLPGCLVRLRMFDPAWQRAHGITEGRIVNIDLDAVVTGPLDPLFDTEDDFTILQHINTTNPCPFNGSVYMLWANTRPDVWRDFSVETVAKVPYHAFPDDQGWLHFKIPHAAAWGPSQGVYGFKKAGWCDAKGGDSEALPANARLVAFPGWRDPSKFERLPWIAENWRLPEKC